MNKKYIEHKASQIRQDYCFQYPLHPEAICIRFGINLIDIHPLTNDGYYISHHFNKYIYCSSHIRGVHRKFVIAHELGHYFLHNNETIQICSGIINAFNRHLLISESESEANAFAAEILLPSQFVKELLPPKQSVTLSTINAIAKQFEVSLTMTGIRCIENSKTQNEILLCYYKGGLKWHAYSDDIEYGRLDRTIPPGSLASDIIENPPTQRQVLHTSNKGIWNYSEDNQVIEECIMIAKDTVLVLLIIE